MHTFDAPIRITDNLQLGDTLFAFSELEIPPMEERYAPIALLERVRVLEETVTRLEQRIADLEAQTWTARWDRLRRRLIAWWTVWRRK